MCGVCGNMSTGWTEATVYPWTTMLLKVPAQRVRVAGHVNGHDRFAPTEHLGQNAGRAALARRIKDHGP